jgi:hypothetical protein
MTHDEFAETILFMRRDCSSVWERILSSIKQLESILWASSHFDCPIRKKRMKLIISLNYKMHALIINTNDPDELDESKSTFFIRSTENVVDSFLKELKVQ